MFEPRQTRFVFSCIFCHNHRLLPTLFLRWKDDGYVLCSIVVGGAFLMVPQQELTQITCVDASGATTEFVLGRVLPGQ